jgi:S-(hydroxymethyl)glutathione dehydrogenase/alcohol dehydrogenase
MKALVLNAVGRSFEVGDVDIVAPVGTDVTQFGVGDRLAAVPKEVPFPQAALLGCRVVTGAGSVLNTAHVRAGDAVLIFGAGGVGLNAVSGARIAGASRIVVIAVAAQRLAEARRFDATDVIDSTTTNPVEAVRDLLLTRL